MDARISSLEQLLGASRVLVSDEARAPYGSDESRLGPFPPDVVVLPETAAEISALLRLAQEWRVPVTPRGLGTGMTGGALAIAGGIVLSTERMNRILAIDPDNLLAVVQPGVITGVLQTAVEQMGLFYPPDPASLATCSLGGNVAENAGGPRAFKYGVTREYVLGLELVLFGGQTLRTGRRTVKGVTGMDLVATVVGSEGTLAVVSEITLKLLPRPQAVGTFLARFTDVVTAGTAVAAMIRQGHRPRTMELLDHNIVEQLRRAETWALPPEPGALLLVEIDGPAEGLGGQLAELARACEQSGATDIELAADAQAQQAMWEMRRGISPILRAQYAHKTSEDIVVPRAKIPEMLRRLDALAAREEVTIATFGHAGDGNLHVNILYQEDRPRAWLDRVIEQVFRTTLDLGGTLTGEHGIGLAKLPYMHLEQPPALLALQRRLKHSFDPDGLLNPGKLLP